MATREHSKKHLLKQNHYIEKLEAKAKALEAEVAVIPPRIRHEQRTKVLLGKENDEMRERLNALSTRSILSKVEYAALEKERNQTLDLHRQQSEMRKMQEALGMGPHLPDRFGAGDHDHSTEAMNLDNSGAPEGAGSFSDKLM